MRIHFEGQERNKASYNSSEVAVQGDLRRQFLLLVAAVFAPSHSLLVPNISPVCLVDSQEGLVSRSFGTQEY